MKVLRGDTKGQQYINSNRLNLYEDSASSSFKVKCADSKIKV